jgi:predicted HTH domain antitoxin
VSAGTANKRTIEVELPEEAFNQAPWEPDRVAEEMRLLWLLEQVRHRRLGFGKAAELAGLPLDRFLDLMHEHQITPFNYDADELDRELG